MVKIPDLTNAFRDNEKVLRRAEEVFLEQRIIGELNLTSGKVVASDPFFIYDASQSFTVSVSSGNYPVILSLAQYNNQGQKDQRVAYAMLRFNEKNPVRWEMAVLPGQDASSLEEDHFFGYGVDSGTGCFLDLDTARIATGLSNDAFEELVNLILKESNKNEVTTWTWTNTIVDSTTNANLVTFSSGWGDGAYPSYFGFDEKGEVTCLITDFGIFSEGDEE